MDPFTQRMLEKAEQRSRVLGISSADVSKFPVSDENVSLNRNALSSACATTMAFATQQQQNPMYTVAADKGSAEKGNKVHVLEKNTKKSSDVSPQKVLRQFSTVNKENMDLGIEINILSDKDVEVQVQVEEKGFTEDENKEVKDTSLKEVQDYPTAKIRDTSRNRLQRLGALYSNADDLSSPIHRTEGKFHAESNEDCLDYQISKPNQRLGKLTALANTINQWEDDTSHHGITSTALISQAPPKPDLKSRDKVVHEKTASSVVPRYCRAEKESIKQLKWDPKVINSLEAQGFQRRESSSLKVSYEFPDVNADTEEISCSAKDKDEVDGKKRAVGKLNALKFVPLASNSATEKKISQADKVITTLKSGLVSGRAALFESQVQTTNTQQQQKQQKDPAELSLRERMNLFEKNKGNALVPKAAFGMAPSINRIQDTKRDESAKAKSGVSSSSVPVVKSFADNKVREKVSALVNAAAGSTIKEDIRKQREEDLQVLANRFDKQKLFLNQQQQQPISSKIKKYSENPATRAEPPNPPPLPENPSNISLTKRRSPGDVIDDDNKRQRTSIRATEQRLYPVLSSLESTECTDSENENNWCTTASVSALSTCEEIKTSSQPLRSHSDHQSNRCIQIPQDDHEDSYMESECEDSSIGMCGDNLGREIMQVVESNDKQASTKKGVHYADRDHFFETSNSSDASNGMDDYLDEALNYNVNEGDEEDNNSELSRDSKGTTVSNSFSFRKSNTVAFEDDKYKNSGAVGSAKNVTSMQPVKSELSVNKENDNMVTLVHTVSFYRKQQNANSACSTPIRKVCREEQVLRSAMQKLDAASENMDFEQDANDASDDSQSDSETDNENLVEEKIKKLLEEVCKQQQVITQASQALNLCAATIEFSGSTESVEAERHLLVATHRRQACLDEVQRLRVEKSLRPDGSSREKGRLTVKEITIPLRQDYIRKLSLDTISGHHLVCLLKYNEHVLATKTVPTLPGLLSVKFPDTLQLNNVYADFKVTLEIYGMTAQREILPHEVKYHINFNKKSGIKTPKKKASENCLIMPPVQSPAGPHAVRTPALVQYGFAIFSLREIQRTSWSLTQVLGVCPLEGVVHMKINCELSISVVHKGFLTMFEEVSGYGAWHRRWCHLNGTVLNYWKYPDDEKKKAPLGSIDLYTCSSRKVNIAPRDICARLNTMILECPRPARDTDRESLITILNGNTTIVRYLLSADTKKERDEWCAYFNKTLTLLRAWGPPQ